MSDEPRHVVVVGAGLAGLVAAVEAAVAGADVTLLEREPAPGGATAQSAGWIWRHATAKLAHGFAPHGDPLVQQLVVDRLDRDLAWLVDAGVREQATGTGRSHTVGARIDPAEAIDRLGERLERLRPGALQLQSALEHATRIDDTYQLRVRRARGASLGDEPIERIEADAVVFAGGGYARDLDRIARECGAGQAVRDSWVLRATAAGDGSSMDVATSLGARRVPADGECLVRLVPDVHDHADRSWLVRAGELQVPGHRIVDANGVPIETDPLDWSGARSAWQLARSTGHGILELSFDALQARTHAGGKVADVVREAIAAGCEGGRLGGAGAWIAVRAGITATRCTLHVDADARLQVPSARRFRRGEADLPLQGAFAAGTDAACTGRGGIASGLAQALVLGRLAGRAAAGGRPDANS